MLRPLKRFAALPFVLLALVLIPGSAGAQTVDTHGLPAPAQLAVPDNPRTVPIKVTKQEYDIKKLLSAPALSPDATAGRALWQQRCAYCHDGMGQPTYKTMGSWIDSDMVKALGADAVKTFISDGVDRMPAFKYEINSKQADAIVEFLKTVSPTLKPTAAQLAGKLPGPGSNAE
jgi:mono/diheme cytochrome c family protein